MILPLAVHCPHLHLKRMVAGALTPSIQNPATESTNAEASPLVTLNSETFLTRLILVGHVERDEDRFTEGHFWTSAMGNKTGGELISNTTMVN